MAYCFVFYADGAKTLVTVWAKYFSAPERFYWVLSENSMVKNFGVTIRNILRVEIS